ncbi:MAG TPA: TolC family protein [Steroidobacteraceae bacterium]|nr:TolC family protein [Steroidobacteraceae bacterium]
MSARANGRSVVVRRGALCVLAGWTSLLAGCAIYHSKPLPVRPDLARAVPASLDPSRGLTEINVITLAVAGNPRLEAERLRAGVARAQLLEAGLLPDPRISGGLTKSSLHTGYDAAVGEDIQALITRGASKDAAAAHLRQVNLEILWQEWQVAERARELYIDAEAVGRLRRVLDRRRRLLGRLYRRDEKSLERRYLTVSAVSADFAAWNTAESDWRALELRENRTRHALDELLGLDPTVRLRLRGAPASAPITAGRFRAAVAALPRRRADLLALRAGYRSEQQRLREAILAQFPLLDAGVQKARSAEEGIQTIGFNVTLTLPLFNRNRGPIAIARATRTYMYRAYQERLDRAVNQADRVFRATQIMQRQLETLDARLPALERAATAAHESLRRGSLSLSDYARVDANALAMQAEAIQLRASLAQARSVLATLLALPF